MADKLLYILKEIILNVNDMIVTTLVVIIYITGVIACWVSLKLLTYLTKYNQRWNDVIARAVISLFSWISIFIFMVYIAYQYLIDVWSDEPPWWL